MLSPFPNGDYFGKKYIYFLGLLYNTTALTYCFKEKLDRATKALVEPLYRQEVPYCHSFPNANAMQKKLSQYPLTMALAIQVIKYNLLVSKLHT